MLKNRQRLHRVLAMVVLAGGCQGDSGGTATGGPGIGTSPTTLGSTGGQGASGEAGSATSTSGANSETDGDTEGPGSATVGGTDTTPSFDLGGGGETTGGPPLSGCQSVDFLFVIDNSVSMVGEQEALVGAFPGFMDAIETVLDVGSDYHIMVVDTDAWGRCDTANPWDGHTPGSGTCNDYVEQTVFDDCEELRGAGVLQPAGQFASNTLCTPASGKRYIEAGEPNLAATFACMATVGTAGHPRERPMNAIEAALDVTNAPVQQCNSGFLRQDALLVITFVSDDAAHEDEGEPLDWYNAVLAAKGGDPSAVVVLGLTPAGQGCGGGGEHWGEFVDMWGENGLNGQVCGTAEEYIAFFQSAVATIDEACEEYDPPG